VTMEASVPTNPREKGAELLGDFRPRMVWNVDVSTHQKANHWTCWVKAEKRMQVRRAIHFEAYASPRLLGRRACASRGCCPRASRTRPPGPRHPRGAPPRFLTAWHTYPELTAACTLPISRSRSRSPSLPGPAHECLRGHARAGAPPKTRRLSHKLEQRPQTFDLAGIALRGGHASTNCVAGIHTCRPRVRRQQAFCSIPTGPLHPGHVAVARGSVGEDALRKGGGDGAYLAAGAAGAGERHVRFPGLLRRRGRRGHAHVPSDIVERNALHAPGQGWNGTQLLAP